MKTALIVDNSRLPRAYLKELLRGEGLTMSRRGYLFYFVLSALWVQLLCAGAFASPAKTSDSPRRTSALSCSTTAYWMRPYHAPQRADHILVIFKTRNPRITRKRIEAIFKRQNGRKVTEFRTEGSVVHERVINRRVPGPGQARYQWGDITIRLRKGVTPADQDIWEVDKTNALQLSRILRKQKGLLRFKRQGCWPPDDSEQYKKMDGLEAEAKMARSELSGMPATVGLVQAEFAAIEQFLRNHQSACSVTDFFIVFGGQKRTMTPLFSHDFSRRPKRPISGYHKKYPYAHYFTAPSVLIPTPPGSTFSPSFWSRAAINPNMPDYATARISVPNLGKANIAVSKAARELSATELSNGEPFIMQAVYSDQLGQSSRFQMPAPSSVEKFRRQLVNIGNLISWNQFLQTGLQGGWQQYACGPCVAAKKVNLLQLELKSRRKVLARLPMIAGLVRAEIARLEPYANQYANAIARPTVQVSIIGPPGQMSSAATLSQSPFTPSQRQNNKSLLNIKLTWAARRGELNQVRSLLDQGADPNFSPNKRYGGGILSPLLNAVQGGHLRILRLLLKRGADPKKEGNGSALLYAVLRKNTDMVRLLLKNGANPNKNEKSMAMAGTPLAVACGWNDQNDWYLAQLTRQLSMEQSIQFMAQQQAARFSQTHQQSHAARNPNVTFSSFTTAIPAYNKQEISNSGSLEIVKLLLKYGADPNTVGGSGNTALMNAAEGGDISIIKFLVGHGADINKARKDGVTALILAVRGNHEDAALYLLKHGANCKASTRGVMGRDVLGEAAIKGNIDIVQSVVNCAGPSSINAALEQVATWGGSSQILRLLFNRGADLHKIGDNLIAMSLHMGHEDIARILLEKGVGINKALYGQTPLMFASARGYPEIVRGLILRGADVNIHETRTGSTALLKAIEHNHWDIAAILMENGADVNVQDKQGISPLLETVYADNMATALMLLKHGANINTQGPKGLTPLIEASADGHSDILRFLIAHGADVNLPTRSGATAYDCAMTRKIQDILKQLGGKKGRGCNGG